MSGPGGGANGVRVEVNDLLIVRGGREILRLPSFRVEPGRVHGLIGPNGAGKSTFLRALAGLEPLDRGEVRIDGTVMAGPAAFTLRRQLAVVFQDPLLVEGTVAYNVELGLRYRGIGRRERSERTRHWLERFGVAHLAERRVRNLSGGEAQRVNLARAFVIDPRLLLLDEPFAALDAPTRSELLRVLKGVLAETGVTAFLVTHDPTELLYLADSATLLMAGRPVQSGSPRQILNRPASAEIAHFLGVENLWPARLSQDGTVELAGQRLRTGRNGIPAGPVLACLRPEHLRLEEPAPEEKDADRVYLSGRVLEVEPWGAQWRLRVQCGVEAVLLVPLTAWGMDGEPERLRPGQAVGLSFHRRHLHLIPRTGSSFPPGAPPE